MMLLLAACQELPLVSSSGVDPEQAWQARQKILSTLQSWDLTGRIGVQTEKDSWQASLRWDQSPDSYAIRLSTPLGQEVMQLHGNASGVTMRTSDGEELAEDAETLMTKRLGWSLPVSGLRYWVLGVADPQAPLPATADKELDGLGRLTRLHQSGWDIEFRRYVTVNNVELPDKIFLSNKQGVQLNVRLAVEQWEIHSKEGG